MTTLSKPRNKTFLQLLILGLMGGGLAILINLIIYFIATAFVPLEVTMPPATAYMPVPFYAVILASMLPAFLAVILLSILQRLTERAKGIFQILAIIVLLASLVGPYDGANNITTAIILGVMHVVAAGAITWALSMRK